MDSSYHEVVTFHAVYIYICVCVCFGGLRRLIHISILIAGRRNKDAWWMNPAEILAECGLESLQEVRGGQPRRRCESAGLIII